MGPSFCFLASQVARLEIQAARRGKSFIVE
jgi:hypothetical protein